MPLLEDFALAMITNLLSGIVQENVHYQGLSYLERRRIMRRVEDATATVVTPLLPFLQGEGITEEKQHRFLQTCIDELRPFTEAPEKLFEGSLDGQKIFDLLYETRPLPQVIIEDDLKGLYTLLFPSIATVVCKIPAAVKDWEYEAWAENFRRLDLVTQELQTLFRRVDALTPPLLTESDETLDLIRKTLTQKIGLDLDLTGLRSETPVSGKFDHFFIHPIFQQQENDPRAIGTLLTSATEILTHFTQPEQGVVIVGPPGSGKSTWTRWLQRELLTPNHAGFAVRTELRQYAREPLPSLYALIRSSVGPHLAEDLTQERLVRWLGDHRLTFIFDGFDEIPPSKRDEVTTWMQDLWTLVRGCPFIVTSRPLTSDHLETLSKSWLIFHLQNFSQVHIIEYITRWYTYSPLLEGTDRQIDAPELARGWFLDPVLKPLTGNPLLLSTLLMVHHMDGRLPAGRSQLYKRYVDGMLGIWDHRRQITHPDISLSLAEKHRILRAIALYMFLEQFDVVDETVLVAWLTDFLKSLPDLTGEHVLATLRERSGLLVGPGIYSFAHKSIAEYLVAETVLQGDQSDTQGNRIDRLRLFNHRNDDRWNTVLFLWAGLATIGDLETFIQACLKSEEWELAGGLLLDQYGRFSVAMRRTFLLQILSHDIDVDADLDSEEPYRYTWQSAGPLGTHQLYEDGAPIEINMPMAPLRGLLHRFHREIRLDQLLRKAVSDSTLDIVCLDIQKPHLYRLLWPSFLLYTRDTKVVTQVLQLPPPSGPTPLSWYILVVSWTVQGVVDGDPLPLAAYASSYQQVLPDIAGLIPLMLISEFLETWSKMRFAEIDTFTTLKAQLQDILGILDTCSDIEVSSNQLAGTRSWGIPNTLFLHIDLLDTFLETLEEAQNNFLLEDLKAVQAATRYVTHLAIKRRENT